MTRSPCYCRRAWPSCRRPSIVGRRIRSVGIFGNVQRAAVVHGRSGVFDRLHRRRWRVIRQITARHFRRVALCVGWIFRRRGVGNLFRAALAGIYRQLPGRIRGLIQCRHQRGGRLNGLGLNRILPIRCRWNWSPPVPRRPNRLVGRAENRPARDLESILSGARREPRCRPPGSDPSYGPVDCVLLQRRDSDGNRQDSQRLQLLDGRCIRILRRIAVLVRGLCRRSGRRSGVHIGRTPQGEAAAPPAFAGDASPAGVAVAGDAETTGDESGCFGTQPI